MSVNHESAFNGHLVAKMTEVRILPNFFWPGLRQDVIRFCHSCDLCQRTIKKDIVKKVPLGSMPLIDMPFKRVADDIVGPIASPMREELQKEVDSMLEMGPSTSPESMTMAEGLFRRLSGKKYLSKIDWTKGYWQIPVAPENVYKTAVCDSRWMI